MTQSHHTLTRSQMQPELSKELFEQDIRNVLYDDCRRDELFLRINMYMKLCGIGTNDVVDYLKTTHDAPNNIILSFVYLLKYHAYQ